MGQGHEMRAAERVLAVVGGSTVVVIIVLGVAAAGYELKSWLGWDVSVRGGLHSFQQCLRRELALYRDVEH